MSDNKRYCGNIKTVQKEWGEQRKVYFTQKDADLIAGEIEQNGGYCCADICKRKEPSEKGVTHYLTINSWRPEKKDDAPQSEPGQFEKQQPVENEPELPF